MAVHKKLTGTINLCKINNLAFDLTYTRSSKVITVHKSGKKIAFHDSPTNLKKRQLAFISHIRKYFEKNFSNYKSYMEISKDMVRYNLGNHYNYTTYQSEDEFGNKKPYCFIELDVSGAYWEVAKNMGFFDQNYDWYLKGINKHYSQQEKDKWGKTKKIDKLTRLIALGSLSRKRRIERYNSEGKKESQEIEYNKNLSNVFFDICMEFSHIMQSIQKDLSNNICFFWTDAFIIRGKNFCECIEVGDLIKEKLKEHGLNAKFEYLANCKFKRTKDNLAFCFEAKQALPIDKWLKKEKQDREKYFMLSGKKNRVIEEIKKSYY